MEKLSGSAPKTLTPAELDPANDNSHQSVDRGDSGDSVDIGDSVAVTYELVAGFEAVTESAATTDILLENATGLDRAARLAGHLFGEHNVAEDFSDRVQFAVVRTAGEELVREGIESLTSRPPTPASIASAVVAAANGAIDVNSDLRVATQIVAEIQPTAPLEGAVGLAIDLLGVLAHGEGPRIADLDAINTRALGGGYGAATQAVSMASNLATDLQETSNVLTGDAAENGEYGVFVRVGNEIGDGLFEATSSRYESEWEFRADP